MLDALFVAANAVVIPVWLLLAIAPSARLTQRLSIWGPALVASLYLGLVVTNIGATDGDFGSLEGIAKLFTDPQVLLAGWVHYLCFDLFVGGWIARDALTRKIGRPWVAPCLFFTLMLGPIGLLMYLGLRSWKGR